MSNFVEGTEDQTGAWSFAQTYTAGAWGLTTMQTPNLSSDGKHLVFTATVSTTRVYVTTRGDITHTFPEPTVLYDLEHGDPELTATLGPDCGRLYVSSSGPPIVWKVE